MKCKFILLFSPGWFNPQVESEIRLRSLDKAMNIPTYGTVQAFTGLTGVIMYNLHFEDP